jgi:hypothetical protein
LSIKLSNEWLFRPGLLKVSNACMEPYDPLPETLELRLLLSGLFARSRCQKNALLALEGTIAEARSSGIPSGVVAFSLGEQKNAPLRL